MIDVSTHIVIECPLDKARVYATDPGNAPEWYDNIKSAIWLTDPQVSLGSTIDFIAYFLGRKLSYTYEVTEMDDAHLAMQTAEGPFPMKTIYIWEAQQDGSTKMTLQNVGSPSGFSALWAPFMARMMKKAM